MNTPSKSGRIDDDDSLDIDDAFEKKLEKKASLETKSEIGKYLLDNLEKLGSYDILDWWKLNASKYPILSKMARDVLAIHISTVAFESAFSTSGRILLFFFFFFFFFLIGKKQIYYKAIKNKETQGRRFQIIHRKYTKRNPNG